MSSVPSKPVRKKATLIKIVVGALVVLGMLVLVMQGVDLKGLVEKVLAAVRSMGPFWFFAAMAVLPAFGFPVMPFSLSAGPVFSSQMGLGWVVVCVLGSLGLNIAITYWLARYAFRPFLEGLVRKLGYDLPRVEKEDHVSLTLVVRITPGPPFFVQGYLLGLADVPFWTYLWISWVISSMYATAVVIFGDSLMQGKATVVVLAASLLVVLGVVVNWVRRRQARRRAERA